MAELTTQEIAAQLHTRANAYFREAERFYRAGERKSHLSHTPSHVIISYATLLATCDVLRILEKG
jgi:hypothetical protein